MIRRNKNYSKSKIENAEIECKDGAEYRHCNFSNLVPYTEILQGFKNLTFYECNLVNCVVPEGSTIIRCNTAQISYCSWLWNKAGIPQCETECEHLIGTEDIKIDGIIVAQNYTRQHKVL